MRSICRLIIVALFILSITDISFGQASIGFKGIGAKLGFAGPEGNIGNPIIFGGLVDLGSITEQIDLGAFVEYWTKSVNSVDFNVFSIAAMGYYHFPMEESSLTPFAGASLGFTRWEGGLPVSNTDIAIGIAGGVDLELSPKATGRAEFKYNLGGIDYWAITGGVIFKMGGE